MLLLLLLQRDTVSIITILTHVVTPLRALQYTDTSKIRGHHDHGQTEVQSEDGRVIRTAPKLTAIHDNDNEDNEDKATNDDKKTMKMG